MLAIVLALGTSGVRDVELHRRRCWRPPAPVGRGAARRPVRGAGGAWRSCSRSASRRRRGRGRHRPARRRRQHPRPGDLLQRGARSRRCRSSRRSARRRHALPVLFGLATGDALTAQAPGIVVAMAGGRARRAEQRARGGHARRRRVGARLGDRVRRRCSSRCPRRPTTASPGRCSTRASRSWSCSSRDPRPAPPAAPPPPRAAARDPRPAPARRARSCTPRRRSAACSASVAVPQPVTAHRAPGWYERVAVSRVAVVRAARRAS